MRAVRRYPRTRIGLSSTNTVFDGTYCHIPGAAKAKSKKQRPKGGDLESEAGSICIDPARSMLSVLVMVMVVMIVMVVVMMIIMVMVMIPP